MKHFTRQSVSLILGILVLAALTAGLLLYLSRANTSDAPSEPSVSSDGTASSLSAHSSRAASSSENAASEQTDEEAVKEQLRAFVNTLPLYDASAGSFLSLEEDGARLTLEKNMTQESIVTGNFSAISSQLTDSNPQLSLYGGCLIFTDGNGEQFFMDENGKILCSLNGFEKAYMRSPSNGYAPLFSKEDSYYFYNAKTGKLEETSSTQNRYLKFDYNSQYGQTTIDLKPYWDKNTKQYGYKNGKGEIVIDANTVKGNGRNKQEYLFTYAYSFNDVGLAVVQYNKSKRLVLIDTTGTVVIDPDAYSYEYTDGTKALDLFKSPKTMGIESVGHYFFDHGYLRVRRQVVDREDMASVLEDYDTLIDASGNYLPLPGGYALRGYSDGILLLEKDGLYGYYTTDGHWLTDPIYTYARPFSGGIGVIGMQDGTVGAIDRNGKQLIPPLFSYLSAVSEDRMVAYSAETGWLLLRLGK